MVSRIQAALRESNVKQLEQRIRTGTLTETQRQEAQGMGFFDFIPKLIGGGIKLLGGILGGGIAPAVGTAAAQVVAARPTPATVAAQARPFTNINQVIADADPGMPGIQVVNPATGQVMSVGGGNGMTTTVTQVMSIDNRTGQVIRTKVFQGAPFLMQKEVAHLGSVKKKLMRGAAKIPTRTRKASRSSMIKDAVEDQMLHLAQGAGLHGHHQLPCPA